MRLKTCLLTILIPAVVSTAFAQPPEAAPKEGKSKEDSRWLVVAALVGLGVFVVTLLLAFRRPRQRRRLLE